MESALCRVNAQVASFTFSDGTQESIDKDTLQKSSMLQSLLSEEVQGSADEQRLTFLGAPQCGYLRSWIQLSRLLTQPEESLEAVSCETIVKFLQVEIYQRGHMTCPCAATSVLHTHCLS